MYCVEMYTSSVYNYLFVFMTYLLLCIQHSDGILGDIEYI